MSDEFSHSSEQVIIPHRKSITGTAGKARPAYSLFSMCANISRLRNETSCEAYPKSTRASVAFDTMTGIPIVVLFLTADIRFSMT